MNFTEFELEMLYNALVLFSCSDDKDIDDFKKDNNLSDDEFDDRTIELRKKINFFLRKMRNDFD